jgi:hypothetical protein
LAGRRSAVGPVNRCFALSSLLPGIQQPGDPVISFLENSPIVFAGGLDPFRHSLEEHVIQPITDIVRRKSMRIWTNACLAIFGFGVAICMSTAGADASP